MKQAGLPIGGGQPAPDGVPCGTSLRMPPTVAVGEGRSKREAQQAAARAALLRRREEEADADEPLPQTPPLSEG